MQIVELGDCSMVIMKDSNDPPWVTVGSFYRQAGEGGIITVEKWVETSSNLDYELEAEAKASEYIYTAGRLILYFKDPIDPKFHLHDVVHLDVKRTRRHKRR